MVLYLIRHGETIEGSQGKILGTIGGQLSPAGISYSQAIAKYFKAQGISLSNIITSDLQRAVDTGRIISDILHIPMTTELLIRERAAGIAEGKLEAEIDWKTYEQLPIEVRKHEGGESFTDVQNRAQQFLDALKNEPQGEKLLIVSHSAFLLMLLSVLGHRSIQQELENKLPEGILMVDTESGSIETLPMPHFQ